MTVLITGIDGGTRVIQGVREIKDDEYEGVEITTRDYKKEGLGELGRDLLKIEVLP